jgi:hypothetical protein
MRIGWGGKQRAEYSGGLSDHEKGERPSMTGIEESKIQRFDVGLRRQEEEFLDDRVMLSRNLTVGAIHGVADWGETGG